MATATPTAIVCIGMAGSGKTTFMQRINAHLHAQKQPPYVMNLDPAVRNVPFDSNIDIRDSINYKEVMSQYNLGPNGGILTSLNLFATKVDQVLAILEKRCGPGHNPNVKAESQTQQEQKPQANEQKTPQQDPNAKPIQHILIDTPGQIEVFVWSASGQILLSTLAATYPTVLAYIIDTPRTCSTSTFMSNMLYACSILYKTKLPMILVFNKADVQSADFAKEWMTDFETFQAALRREEETGAFGGTEGTTHGPAIGGSGYMGSLLNSMSLVLEEFYRHLSVVGVSAVTGQGVDEFFEAVEAKTAEFERDYWPELERRRQERDKDKAGKREQELGRLMRDMNMAGSQEQSTRRPARRPRDEPETISDMEDEDDEDEDDQPEAEMVEPDFPEDDDEDDEMGEQPSRRPAEPLGGENILTSDDASFLRYVRSANMNK